MTEQQLEQFIEEQEEFWNRVETESARLEITVDYYLMEFC